MESLFIQNMFKEMRASIPKSGLTSGGKAEEMFTDMLDAEMAKTVIRFRRNRAFFDGSKAAGS